MKHHFSMLHLSVKVGLFVCVGVFGVAAGVAYAQTSTPATDLSLNTNYLASDGTIVRQLAQGINGNDVVVLQSFLAQYPSIYPSSMVTGYFGPLTRSAVIRYQKQNGLAQDGTLTAATLLAINTQLLSYKSPTSPGPASSSDNINSGTTSTTTPTTVSPTSSSTTNATTTASTTPMLIPSISVPLIPSLLFPSTTSSTTVATTTSTTTNTATSSSTSPTPSTTPSVY